MLLLAFNLIVNRPSQESGCVVCVCQSWGKSKEGRKDESGRKGQKKVARRIVEKRKRDAMVDRWRRNRISLLSPPDLLLLTPTPTKIKRQVWGGGPKVSPTFNTKPAAQCRRHTAHVFVKCRDSIEKFKLKTSQEKVVLYPSSCDYHL
jgi:hypothetical protein